MTSFDNHKKYYVLFDLSSKMAQMYQAKYISCIYHTYENMIIYLSFIILRTMYAMLGRLNIPDQY
jgi:hypothetical protein